MSILNKAGYSPNACAVSLYFSGIPSKPILPGSNVFFDSYVSGVEASDLYITSGSVKFSEVSNQTRAALIFTQTVQFSLPTTDEFRSARIDQFRKVKFIKIKLSNGKEFFFGRNDFKQNAKPKLKIASSEKITTIQFTQTSLLSIGYATGAVFTFQDGIKFLFQNSKPFN